MGMCRTCAYKHLTPVGCAVIIKVWGQFSVGPGLCSECEAYEEDNRIDLVSFYHRYADKDYLKL